MAPYVLVVESDPELQRRIGDTLRQANYELAAETEGAWAKRSLLVRPPDAVILGTALSDISGFAVAEALRKDPDTRSVPIFFVDTRIRGAAHEAEARRRYAPAEYLRAPVDLDSLLAVVLQRVPPGDPLRAPVLPPDPAVADRQQKGERSAVELAAPELGGSAELRGHLASDPFARFMQRIYAGRATGALLLVRDDTKKIVYFSDGYPVSVRSNVLEECLGQILLTMRLISPEVLSESLQRMQSEGKQQGAILVEMGVLSPYNLQRALAAQMEAKLLDVFSWSSGELAFSRGKPAPDEPVRLESSPAALILEGIRRHYDEERISAVLAPYTGRLVAPSSDPRARLQDITENPVERRFVDSVDGTKTLETLLAQAPVPLARARLLLVAMSEAAMIAPGAEVSRDGAPVPEPVAEAPATEPTVTPSPFSAAARQESTDLTLSPFVTPERPVPARSRDELLLLAEAMRHQTHFEILGVTRASGTAEIERAYAALAREYHPDRFQFRAEELRRPALEVFERLGDAYQTLRDTQRRADYAAELEREEAARHPSLPAPLYGREPPRAAAERVYFAGVEHLRARRYGQAVHAFRQATQLAPGDAGYRSALGWALFRQAPADPAAVAAGKDELSDAVEMDPANAVVRVSLARFFAETGHPDDAIAEFEVALRLDPNLADIEDEIRRLRGLP